MSVALNNKHQGLSLRGFFHQFRNPLRTFHQNPDDLNPEFVIDSIEGQPGFYQLTAQGPRLRQGESIGIVQSGQYCTYQVDDIEYYSEPSDMWMAVLHKV